MLAQRPAFPDGHFYSPVVDIDEVARNQQRIWPDHPDLQGIRFRPSQQRRFLTRDFRRYVRDYDYPDEPRPEGDAYQFYTKNPQFSWLDARALFVMLRSLRPRTMIEVGSGFSSLLTADVNRRFFGNRLEFISIDPFPPAPVAEGVPGISRLVRAKVEDVPLSEFQRLHRGDVLFIDSSHVSKTGSDVNRIVFEILPRLQAGVVIHFHDVFLPNDYPRDWVLGEGRSWNEQYVLRALLMFTDAFEILFASAFVHHYFPDVVAAVLGGQTFGGGSLWLRRTRGTGFRRQLLAFGTGLVAGYTAGGFLRRD